jgi:hypothetical protein
MSLLFLKYNTSIDYLFTLKFTTKQLVRQSKKAEKQERQEKLKLKKVIINNTSTLMAAIVL